MCDFEDIDLNRIRPKSDEWIEPRVYTGKSMEELGEDEPEADDELIEIGDKKRIETER